MKLQLWREKNNPILYGSRFYRFYKTIPRYMSANRNSAAIEARGAVAVIPPRKNRMEMRCYDAELYKTRNLIERFIGYLKRYRRVFSRYDKLAVRYLGFVYFATVLIQCR